MSQNSDSGAKGSDQAAAEKCDEEVVGVGIVFDEEAEGQLIVAQLVPGSGAFQCGKIFVRMSTVLFFFSWPWIHM
jgi:hypothetical protein